VWDLWNQRNVAANLQAFPSIEILICPSDPADTIGEPLLSYVGNAGFIGNDNSAPSAVSGLPGRPENPANGVFFDRTRTLADGAGGPNDLRDPATAFEPMKKMTVAYIQAKGDGTTKTMMFSESINAIHWGYAGAIASTVLDQKYHFGFCWEQPAAIITDLGTTTMDFESDIKYRSINGIPEPLPGLLVNEMTINSGFPSSNHPGGVQAAFVGGQVVFISDQIDNLVYAQILTSNHKKSDLKNVADNTWERDLPQPSEEDY